MNKDQVTGKIDQVTGKIKQGVGEAVNDQELADRGLVDQVKGAAKETWGNVKDATNKRPQDDANRTREKVSEKVDDLKNRSNEKIDSIKEQHRIHDHKDRTA